MEVSHSVSVAQSPDYTPCQTKTGCCMQELTATQLREQLTALQGRCMSAEDKLAAAEEASTAAQNRYLRLNADWENYRKRMVTPF